MFIKLKLDQLLQEFPKVHKIFILIMNHVDMLSNNDKYFIILGIIMSYIILTSIKHYQIKYVLYLNLLMEIRYLINQPNI